MGAGREGGRGGERDEREGESTNKYTQVQTRHNKTQNNTREGRKTTRGNRGKILRSVKAAVRIFLKVEGRDQYIQ